MPSYTGVLGICLAVVAISAWCVLTSIAVTHTGNSIDQVLYTQGSSLRVPGMATVDFTVTAPGGFLAGSIYWDHSSVAAMVALVGSHVTCPVTSLGYSGSPWTQWVNTTLPKGQYEFGALCGGFGNGTVNQTIEVLFP